MLNLSRHSYMATSCCSPHNILFPFFFFKNATYAHYSLQQECLTFRIGFVSFLLCTTSMFKVASYSIIQAGPFFSSFIFSRIASVQGCIFFVAGRSPPPPISPSFAISSAYKNIFSYFTSVTNCHSIFFLQAHVHKHRAVSASIVSVHWKETNLSFFSAFVTVGSKNNWEFKLPCVQVKMEARFAYTAWL